MDANGTEDSVVDPARQHIIDGLKELLQTESAHVMELRAALDEVTDRRDGYQQALDALTGDPRPKRPASRKKEERPSADSWRVSDKKVAEVEQVIRGMVTKGEERFTAASIAKSSKVSPEGARRALNVLREREVVRVTGSARGGGTNYALMAPAGD